MEQKTAFNKLDATKAWLCIFSANMNGIKTKISVNWVVGVQNFYLSRFTWKKMKNKMVILIIITTNTPALIKTVSDGWSILLTSNGGVKV